MPRIPCFPAFPTQMELPSTSGGASVRRTTWTYNSSGDRISETRTGAEAGSAFSLTTAMTYNPAGQMLTSDPPGYGTEDVTSYTYDPSRGNLVPLTRTDRDPNVTIRCESDRTGRCSAKPGFLGCGWSVPHVRVIHICPDASEPGCGPLGCTVLHELTHILGHPRETLPKLVEKCLRCD